MSGSLSFCSLVNYPVPTQLVSTAQSVDSFVENAFNLQLSVIPSPSQACKDNLQSFLCAFYFPSVRDRGSSIVLTDTPFSALPAASLSFLAAISAPCARAASSATRARSTAPPSPLPARSTERDIALEANTIAEVGRDLCDRQALRQTQLVLEGVMHRSPPSGLRCHPLYVGAAAG